MPSSRYESTVVVVLVLRSLGIFWMLFFVIRSMVTRYLSSICTCPTWTIVLQYSDLELLYRYLYMWMVVQCKVASMHEKTRFLPPVGILRIILSDGTSTGSSPASQVSTDVRSSSLAGIDQHTRTHHNSIFGPWRILILLRLLLFYLDPCWSRMSTHLLVWSGLLRSRGSIAFIWYVWRSISIFLVCRLFISFQLEAGNRTQRFLAWNLFEEFPLLLEIMLKSLLSSTVTESLVEVEVPLPICDFCDLMQSPSKSSSIPTDPMGTYVGCAAVSKAYHCR